MKKLILTIFCIFSIQLIFSQEKITAEFAVKDTNHLFLDVYKPTNLSNSELRPCFVYVFGGGFIKGRRDDTTMVKAYKALTEKGFVVVAIDYRLGLKGVKRMNMNMNSVYALEHAIRIAVEDLYSATNYICQNYRSLQIDTSKIIISGGSAGAITVLQGDYWLHSGDETAKVLPQGFRYAGVIPLSGAIFSMKGKLKYNTMPAPTFFLHGTEDHLVTYSQLKFANIGLYGSSKIVEVFEKSGYAYHFKRMKNFGHEVAGLLPNIIDEINDFYQEWIVNSKKLQVDELWYNPDYEPIGWGKMKPSDLYN